MTTTPSPPPSGRVHIASDGTSWGTHVSVNGVMVFARSVAWRCEAGKPAIATIEAEATIDAHAETEGAPSRPALPDLRIVDATALDPGNRDQVRDMLHDWDLLASSGRAFAAVTEVLRLAKVGLAHEQAQRDAR